MDFEEFDRAYMAANLGRRRTLFAKLVEDTVAAVDGWKQPDADSYETEDANDSGEDGEL